MTVFFQNFFPPGFWRTVAMMGTVLFFVFGLDLLFGARLMGACSRTMNRKFHFDHHVVQALTDLKKASDREFDTDRTLLTGWGRFVVCGLLICGAVLIFTLLVPKLH